MRKAIGVVRSANREAELLGLPEPQTARRSACPTTAGDGNISSDKGQKSLILPRSTVPDELSESVFFGDLSI